MLVIDVTITVSTGPADHLEMLFEAVTEDLEDVFDDLDSVQDEWRYQIITDYLKDRRGWEASLNNPENRENYRVSLGHIMVDSETGEIMSTEELDYSHPQGVPAHAFMTVD